MAGSNDDVKIWVNGAYIPEYLANGRKNARAHWRIGNFLLTGDRLDLTTKTDRYSIPIGTIQAVTSPPTSVQPPRAGFDQILAVHHGQGTKLVSLIAFPPVTVQNFPLQLAAVLTGEVNAHVPQDGPDGKTTYEGVRFRFHKGHVEITRRVGGLRIPLDEIASLSPHGNKDSQGREFVEWVVDYVQNDAIRSLRLLSRERIPFLYSLLRSIQGMRKASGNTMAIRATEGMGEMEEQVAAMLYTGGMGASDIEQALGISSDDLDRIYDDLLRRGLAEVVRTRKEIKLNASGVKAVDEFMKKQLEGVS